MADNKSLKDERDRTSINPNEKYELDYWSKKFNVTSEELREAIQKSESNNVKNIEVYFRTKQQNHDK